MSAWPGRLRPGIWLVLSPVGFTLIVCPVGLAVNDISTSVSIVDSVLKLKDATTFAGLKPAATCAYSVASPRWAPVNWQRGFSVGSVMLGQVGPPEFSAARKLA
jgi:hypothetical protein